MTDTAIDPTEYAHRHAYHCGAFSYAVSRALVELERHETSDPVEAAVLLRRAWQEYEAAGLGDGYLRDALWAGFVVEAANGEAQAYRGTFAEAQAAISDVMDYWYQAETCGHPDAPGFVAKLYPFRVRQVTQAEADELAEYPAVIDREG